MAVLVFGRNRSYLTAGSPREGPSARRGAQVDMVLNMGIHDCLWGAKCLRGTLFALELHQPGDSGQHGERVVPAQNRAGEDQSWGQQPGASSSCGPDDDPEASGEPQRGRATSLTGRVRQKVGPGQPLLRSDGDRDRDDQDGDTSRPQRRAPLMAYDEPDANNEGSDLCQRGEGQSAGCASEADHERSCEEYVYVSEHNLGDEEGGQRQPASPSQRGQEPRQDSRLARYPHSLKRWPRELTERP